MQNGFAIKVMFYVKKEKKKKNKTKKVGNKKLKDHWKEPMDPRFNQNFTSRDRERERRNGHRREFGAQHDEQGQDFVKYSM